MYIISCFGSTVEKGTFTKEFVNENLIDSLVECKNFFQKSMPDNLYIINIYLKNTMSNESHMLCRFTKLHERRMDIHKEYIIVPNEEEIMKMVSSLIRFCWISHISNLKNSNTN